MTQTPALDDLVAAARDAVEIWRAPHMHDTEEWDSAMARLAELLPPEDDGRRWPQRQGDPF